MRVVTDQNETIELGDVETTPTIGITDFSRRVTDDFGVTTVVERGFSRRMSVKLGVQFDAVDALQRRLANLRATSALWVADDRFASLSLRGFYKDFALDLATQPLSYCTLTVEGLAETATPADVAGDPAPVGQSSTLQLLQPVTVAGSVLVSSTVAENDAAEWSASATYAMGVRVMRAATHRVYESLVAANVGSDPAGVSGKWLDVGPTNRWSMFDEALGTSTTNANSIQVVLNAGSANAVALLDVIASTVRVRATGYDRTAPAGTGAITFLDLPANAGTVTVTIAGTGTVSVGTLLIGRVTTLGLTEASPTAGITDFSRKDVDEFGEVTIVQRAWAKRMTASALIRTDAVDMVANRIAAVRAKPSLWIGQTGLDSLTVYGFFKDFSIEVGETLSKLSLSIEGLSAAVALAPIGGGGSVAWLDVTDPTGTKPSDNADVTAENTSKDTNAVGGTPAKTVLDAAASIKARTDTLESQTIPAINTAVAQADTRIMAARAAADAAKVRADAGVSRADAAFVEIGARVTEVNTRIDTIETGGGYDDTTVRAEIGRVDTAAIGRDAALTQSIQNVTASISTTDTNLRALVTTKEQAAVSREDAISQRITDLIAEGGGGSEGVDAVARAEISRVEQAAISRDGAIGQRVDAVQVSFSKTPQMWRARSQGASSTRVGYFGVVGPDGTVYGEYHRSYTVVVFEQDANRVETVTGFDIYGNSTAGGTRAQMVTHLNSIAAGKAIVIYTSDEPANFRYQVGLADAMALAGAGEVFFSPNFKVQAAYVLVSRARIGRGGGQEYYAGDVDYSANAWLDVPFAMADGHPQLGNGKAQFEANVRIEQVSTAFADATSALGRRIDTVSASFGPAINAKAVEITSAYTSADQALGSRSSTLESQMSRQLPSELNKFTDDVNNRLTQVNTSVNARIKSSEDVIADLPNRYAAASRTAALEAQVAGQLDSGLSNSLSARIEDRATAIANAKAGAVAQTVSQLRAEYNNTAAAVATTAGAIASLQGRTAAYWRTTAVAGNNRAQITISADANAGAGVDIIGDVSISGNLLVSGSVVTDRIALNGVTNTVAIAGMSGGGVSAGDTGESGRLTITSTGGTMKVDVQSDGTRTAGSGTMRAQLFAAYNGTEIALSREVAFSPSNTAVPIGFFQIIGFPVGTVVQFFLRFFVTTDNTTWNYTSAAIAVTEFKR
jgi:hypothetical protein